MVGKKRKLSGGDALTPKESIELKRLKQTVESLTAQLRDRDEQELRMNSQIMDLRQQLESLRHQVDLAQPRSLMHIHDLPNQLVLRVLSLLDPLFVADSVANVCRRWRRLASHSAIWQAVELHYGNTGEATAADIQRFVRALATAPVLESLECGLTAHDPAAVHRALEGCRVAAAHLCIDLDVAAPEAVLCLLDSSLPRLEIFSLREGPLSSSAFSERQAARFWQQVEEAAAASLRCLVLFLSQRSGLVSSHHCCRPSSSRPGSRTQGHRGLRTLFVDVGAVEEEHPQAAGLALTLASLIDAQRDTLQDVHLPIRVPTVRPLQALARCRALSRLTMPAATKAEVSLLAGCGELKVLRLKLDPRHPIPASLLLEGVARLHHLRELELLQQLPRTGGDAESAGQLVLGSLTVLPGLRKLTVSCLPPSAAIKALSLLASPPASLEILAFEESCGDTQGAADCRLAALRRLLSLWPGVHILQKSAALGEACIPQHLDLVRAMGDRRDRPSALVCFLDGDIGHGSCLVCQELVKEGRIVIPCNQPAVNPEGGVVVVTSSSVTRLDSAAEGSEGPGDSVEAQAEGSGSAPTTPAAEVSSEPSVSSPRLPSLQRRAVAQSEPTLSPGPQNESPPIKVSIALEKLDPPHQSQSIVTVALPAHDPRDKLCSSQVSVMDCMDETATVIDGLPQQMSESMAAEGLRSPAPNGVSPHLVGPILATPAPTEALLFSASAPDAVDFAVAQQAALPDTYALTPTPLGLASSDSSPNDSPEGEDGKSNSRKNRARACRPTSFKPSAKDFEGEMESVVPKAKKPKSSASARPKNKRQPLKSPRGLKTPTEPGTAVPAKSKVRNQIKFCRPIRPLLNKHHPHNVSRTPTQLIGNDQALPVDARPAGSMDQSANDLLPRFQPVEPAVVGFTTGHGRVFPLRKSAPAALIAAGSSLNGITVAAPPTAHWPTYQINEVSPRQAGVEASYDLSLDWHVFEKEFSAHLLNDNVNNNFAVTKPLTTFKTYSKCESQQKV